MEQTKRELNLDWAPYLKLGPSWTPFFFFLANSTIILESELKFKFELKFCWVQIQAWAQNFLHIKTWKKIIQVWNFYLELVGLFLRRVEISWGLRAFSLFLHKEIKRKDSSKNEHLYTSMDLSPTSLFCETLRKGKQLFSRKWYFIEDIKSKLRLLNIELMVFFIKSGILKHF